MLPWNSPEKVDRVSHEFFGLGLGFLGGICSEFTNKGRGMKSSPSLSPFVLAVRFARRLAAPGERAKNGSDECRFKQLLVMK